MSVDRLKKRLERLAGKDGRDEDILEILHQLNSIPMSVEILKETHIGKTVNALKKRKGVVGSSALNLINSWKQMVNEVSKPKPKIVVEPCHSSSEDEASEDEGDEDEDEDEEVAEAISHSRVSHTKKSSLPNPNLRTFNMFEGVKQPSYSRTKTRSLSPMPSSHSESPSSSTCSPLQNKSLSPQPHSSGKKRVPPLTDSPSLDIVALSKRSRTQVYSGKRSGFSDVPTLFDLALKVLMNNINVLEEVKGVPYRIMEPVLARCSPSQLQRLESFNPHFLGRGDSLWQKHCQKEFKGTQLQSGQTWRDLYMEQVSMREERLKKISDNINAKKLQQEPVRTVKIAEATRMRRRQRNLPPQIFTPGNQAKSVTPLMSKAQKMFKERSLMFGSSKPRR